ncbi:MAG TPA: hypothetical protein VGL89_16650 [Candidatus Koribacter sp.]|jgi:hypothetical protein
MDTEHDHSYESPAPKGPNRDRLDWISKYLELADKLIESRMLDHAVELDRS